MSHTWPRASLEPCQWLGEECSHLRIWRGLEGAARGAGFQSCLLWDSGQMAQLPFGSRIIQREGGGASSPSQVGIM